MAHSGSPNRIMLQKPFAPAQLATAVSQLLNMGSLADPERDETRWGTHLFSSFEDEALSPMTRAATERLSDVAASNADHPSPCRCRSLDLLTA